ncbi:MAG: hypothetical protein HFJ06_12350 [Lachnospiraceae bacterium]|nr:hypothetical protein [Lachnospiraceae bacterium]
MKWKTGMKRWTAWLMVLVILSGLVPGSIHTVHAEETDATTETAAEENTGEAVKTEEAVSEEDTAGAGTEEAAEAVTEAVKETVTEEVKEEIPESAKEQTVEAGTSESTEQQIPEMNTFAAWEEDSGLHEEQIEVLEASSDYLICSDGSWSGGTIWYVQPGKSRHYIFCLEKGATMYHAKYTGEPVYGYSGKSAFKKAVALNFFYKTNGNSWSGKKNYGPVQEVIWDETGSSTAQKLTAYIDHAWKLTSLNSGRSSSGTSFNSKLQPIAKSSADSEAARKKMIGSFSKTKTKVKEGEQTQINLGCDAWQYFADGGYNSDGLVSGGKSSSISVTGVYDKNGKATKSTAFVDERGHLQVTAVKEAGKTYDKSNPLTVIMKVNFDYQGADKIRYLKTAEGVQNLAYDASFGMNGYFALQVYAEPDNPDQKFTEVCINKVDEYGLFVPGCTFELSKSVALGQYEVVDDVITEENKKAVFEIKEPGSYRIVETGVPSDDFQINPTEYKFTAMLTMEGKDSKLVIMGAGNGVANPDGSVSYTYTCENKFNSGSAEIVKYGKVLAGYQDGKFIYETRTLPDVGFTFYAAENIYANSTLVFQAGEELTAKAWGNSHKAAVGIKTDGTGRLVVSDLPSGSYYCVESAFPPGFTKHDRKYYFQIEAEKNKLINEGEGGIYNEQAPAVCHVYKVDHDTNKPLGGGEFTIYADVANTNYDGNAIFAGSDTVPAVIKRDLASGKEEKEEGRWVPLNKVTTRADGMAEFGELPAGRYLVTETKAPEGYALAEESYIFTHSYDTEQGASGYNFVHTFTDVRTRSYEIVKHKQEAVPADPEQKNMDVYIYEDRQAEGAVFGIYAAEDIYNTSGTKVYTADTLVTECTTDENGVAEWNGGFYAGSYYFKELKTPDDSRYILDDTKYPFSVSAENSGVLNKEPIVNKLYKGSIKVIKTDGKTKVPLEGVEFDLLDAGEKKLGSFATDKNGEILIENLPVGTYYIKETLAKKGYLLSGERTEITLSKETLNRTVGIDNWMKGSIKVIKTDGKTKVPLKGVGFDLLDAGKKKLGSFITDKNGEIYISDLEPGIYYIKETKALKGYRLTDELAEVVITKEYPDHTVNMKNFRNGTSITIRTNTTITGSGHVKTGDIGMLGFILALFILSSTGAAVLMKRKGIMKIRGLSVKGKKFLLLMGILTGTAIAGGLSVKAVSNLKEISTVELEDAESEGQIYTYALQKQYETTDKDQKIEFEEKTDGMKLDKVDYQVIKTVPQTKALEKTKDYKNLQEKDETKVKDTIEEDGNTYRLKDITWSEEPNIEHVSYTQELGSFPSEPEHADTYEYTYTSPITKKENTVTLPFARMEHSEYGWIEGFTATVTFHNLDGEVFNLGNHEFHYNPDRLDLTEADYEELVRMLGYDTSQYRLTGASWSGKPYKDKNGGKNRDATAYGQQYGASFRAVYEDDVENGKTYTAHAVYSCEVELPEEEAAPTFVMQATAYYKKAEVPLLVSVGIVILVILVIGILYVISGKRAKGIRTRISDGNSRNREG